MILRPVMPIDVEGRVRGQEAGGGELFADDAGDGLLDGRRVHVGGGLVGADDVGDGQGLALAVEDGNLGFGVGAQPGDFAGMAELGQAAEDAVGADEGEGEVLGRLVRRVAEHHALVACALLLGVGAGDALVDVGRLGVKVVDVSEVLPAEALLGAVVANLADDVLGDGLGVEALEAGAGNLAQIGDQVHAAGRLAGDVGMGVKREAGVEDGVGDGVCHLVGMPFGDGFRGIDVSGEKLAHGGSNR